MLIIASVVGASVLLTGAGLLAAALFHPDWPLAEAFGSFTHALGLLIGAVLGYLAGRGRSQDGPGRP